MSSAFNLPGFQNSKTKSEKGKKTKEDANGLRKFAQRVADSISGVRSDIKDVEERSQQVQLKGFKLLNDKIDGLQQKNDEMFRELRVESHQNILAMGQLAAENQKTQDMAQDNCLQLAQLKVKYDELNEEVKSMKESGMEEILTQQEESKAVVLRGQAEIELQDLMDSVERENAGMKAGYRKKIGLCIGIVANSDRHDSEGIGEGSLTSSKDVVDFAQKNWRLYSVKGGTEYIVRPITSRKKSPLNVIAGEVYNTDRIKELDSE